MPGTTYTLSKIGVGTVDFLVKDDSLTTLVGQIIEAIGANNDNVADRINNLHSRSFDAEIKISSQAETEISNIIDGLYKLQYVTITGEGTDATETLNNSAILIQKGTNQYLIKDGQISSRTKTNDTWGTWTSNNVKPDWEAVAGSDAEILNKPDLSNFLTIETQPDWNITATTSAAFIKNKPEIPAIIYWQFTEEVENEISTWNTNGHTVSELSQILLNSDILLLILMKDVDGVNAIYKHAGWSFFLPFNSGLGGEPITKAYMMSEGENDQINIEKINVLNPISFSSQFEGDPTGRFVKICGDYIDNDNNFERYTSQILVDDEGIKLTTHQFATATYNGYEIATKNDIPTVPTVSATVIQNDANPVSGSAVYSKFADLIGAAPAALDTLTEIASALNNDADLAGTLTTQISSKVPKVSSPTPDNFASFNSDGTIKDSGHSHSDYITSIKTVNNESLVGSGNVVISGLPQVSASDNGKILMVVNGQWQLVSPSVLYTGQGIPNNAQGNNGDIYMQTD